MYVIQLHLVFSFHEDLCTTLHLLLTVLHLMLPIILCLILLTVLRLMPPILLQLMSSIVLRLLPTVILYLMPTTITVSHMNPIDTAFLCQLYPAALIMCLTFSFKIIFHLKDFRQKINTAKIYFYVYAYLS